MGAGTYNFSIEQGSDFDVVVTYKTSTGVAINVNGYHAAMKIRKSWDSANAIISLTDGTDDHIQVGTTDGTFTIGLTAAETAALDFDTAVYDLELTVPTTLKKPKLLRGQVTLIKEVTK